MPVKASVKIDLSHLPKGVQDAVGAELATSIVKSLKLGSKPVIVGKLDPGIYGYVMPDAVLGKQIREFSKGLK